MTHIDDDANDSFEDRIPPGDANLLARDPALEQALGDPTASPLERVRFFVEKTLAHAGFGNTTVTLREDDGNILVDIAGPDARAIVTQPNGVDSPVVLDALAALARRIAFPAESEPRPVVVDADNYRSRRTEQLGELADYLVDKVTQDGLAISIYGMNSVDRRAVHRAMGEGRGAVTQSAGVGIFRRLTVRQG